MPNPVFKSGALDVDSLAAELVVRVDASLEKRHRDLLTHLEDWFSRHQRLNASRCQPDVSERSLAYPLIQPLRPSFEDKSKGLETSEPTSMLKRKLERQSSYARAVDVHNQKAEKKMTTLPSTQSRRERSIEDVPSSWPFELFFGTAIFLNAITIGVQVDYIAKNAIQSIPFGFQLVQHVFTFLFLVELLVRIMAERCKFFRSSWWNIFDLVIVVSSVTESVMEIIDIPGPERFTKGTSLRIFRVLRITRLAKVVRIVMIVRFIGALRTLVQSIAMTLRHLLWAMLLLTFVLFVFGIMFTDIVTSHTLSRLSDGDDLSDDFLKESFGSLDASMLTLFATISGGLEWKELYVALNGVSTFWAIAFLGYLTFCMFAVLNVMTAVFCQAAIQSAERDHDHLVQSVLEDRHLYIDGLQKLFASIDDDGNGCVTIKEFEAHFNDEAVRCVFRALELDPSDAWELFATLDRDGSGTIDADEFLEGCLYIRGVAKAVNLAALARDISKMRTSMNVLANAILSSGSRSSE
eukprot:TRINITY_DN56499_c0_g1_i1.p1 TRINITY_DN56499_c0_g1~~TRINITY_DN56499_c0_g1_i1.p1  ORF type:complete len:522 (-),score=30.56 TRINITY_DN56499_c0_g1_i1:12-1577(-)